MPIIALPSEIGLLGGTFDPVHVAHIECALEAKRQLGLETVCLLPAGNPSFKQDARIAPFKDRLEMCRLAIEGTDGLEVNDIEGRDGITYTVDTARQILATHPEVSKIHFIIGSDAFLLLDKWKDSKDLVDLVSFAVFMRPGDAEREVSEAAKISGANIALLRGPAMDVSSTRIREMIERGADVGGLLPDKVTQYIKDKGLYDA